MSYDPTEEEDEDKNSADDEEDAPAVEEDEDPVKEEDNPVATEEAPIKSPYEMATDNSAVQAAMDKAKSTNKMSMIANGIANIVNPYNPQGNNQFFSGLRQNAANQVGQAEQQRQAAIKNWTMAQQQKQNDRTNALNDPASQESAAVRNAYRKMFSGVVDQIDNFDTLSANDVNQYMSKPMELKNAADTRAAYMKENAAARAQSANEHQQAMGQIRQDNKDQKTAENQEKAWTDMYNHMLGARAPQDVQQARQATKAIASAQELINQYPDTDKMPVAQVRLLNAEIAKVAQGGVPSEGEMKGLDPGTLQEHWQGFLAQTGNEPTGAQLRGFIQQNQNYLKGLAQVNQNVVDKFERDTYEGTKNRLSSAQRMRFENEERPALFKQRPATNIGAQPKPESGTAYGAPSGAPTKTMIQAPDGSQMLVPQESVEKYLKKGGKVVQ